MLWSGYRARRRSMNEAAIMEAARSAGLLDGPMTEAAERVMREIELSTSARPGVPTAPHPDK
jgi:hypothetical protein